MNQQRIVLLSLSLLFIPASAHAYIDPGTGGLLFQLGFAFFSLIIGWLFMPFRVIKDRWTRFKNGFKKA